MISLIQSGEYDGVSASGNTSVRLMAAGDVAPVNPELLPNYADVTEGIKPVVQLEGRRAVRRTARPWAELLVFRTDDVTPAPDSWWRHLGRRTREYKGKISIYDDSIFIADAALYLKATQPDLGIENPYQLTQEQFDASVALLKKLAPNVGELVGRRMRSRSSRSPTRTASSGPPGRAGDPADGDEQPVVGRSSRRRARRAGRTRG